MTSIRSESKKYYIGIDLGTTNSAICSFDGENVNIWKTAEQNDVTPSALYVDKRGNRYYGKRAYDQAPHNPDNSATLFKRFMGTSTKINLSALGISMTPEECSAEILRVLFGYLPEEMRCSKDASVVITVPAAFNQMQKEATLEAAQSAGLGKVALMQEPVAAIMSIMRTRKQEGTFLVYDLGGGTFDISIADNYSGKVNLLALGGKASCGGRDFDRLIYNKFVVPWLFSNFKLPEDFTVNPQYIKLNRLAHWAAEKAKIELSSRNESIIALNETEVRAVDLDENEIYLDIPLSREDIDPLFEELIMETVEETRDTLAKVGLTTNDVDRIVFIGGPTKYKPLRDKVIFELSLPPVGTDTNGVNPMTAVAEGASIFAESIDWNTEKHYRKSTTGEVKSSDNIDVSFKYVARTAQNNARVIAQIGKGLEGFKLEIKSIDSGWISGRMVLEQNKSIELPLINDGENIFEIILYNALGQPIKLQNGTIIITKTMASVESIPASHSIGIEVLGKLGGGKELQFIVQDGDPLPKKGWTTVKAGQTIKAGSNHYLRIKIWEGGIQEITDNRFIGMLKISGTDFENGIIATGDELKCEYEVSDSGNINFEVSVQSIGATFPAKFIIDDKPDLSNVEKVIEDGQKMLDRIETIMERLASENIDDPKLHKAKQQAEKASLLDDETSEPEDVQKAIDEVLHAKKMVAQVGSKYRKPIRQMDLEHCVEFFNEYIRQHAKLTEENAFDNQVKAAQRSIDRNDDDFNVLLDELRSKNWQILWRQDWFVVQRFNQLVKDTYNYSDLLRFEQLKQLGMSCLQSDDINKLRDVVYGLYEIQITSDSGEEMLDNTNIIRGQ